MNRILASLLLSLACVSQVAAQPAAFPFMPQDHKSLTRTITYGEMEILLKAVDGKGPVQVSAIGATTNGRTLYAVHLSRTLTPAWKVLFYAQQHGDEISGKDALLYLVRDVAAKPELLPKDVDVWIVPMMNPDGAEAGTRVNGAGADLNRDHIILDQPETRALHQLVRQVRPDVTVDCHEFAKVSESYAKRGWTKWPEITMDGLNNPLFDPAVIAAADRWVKEAADAEKQAGHRFLRYWVGGAPPDDEQRHSAPDIDSGLNAVGMYGDLSFIIEAAAGHDEKAIERELGTRVDAYLVLLRRFINGDGHRSEDLAAIRRARSRTMPQFIPTNYLWTNPSATVTRFPVIETATGKTVDVPTPNMMTQLVVKRSVPAPLAYAIDPAAAPDYATLLDRHAIPYERLAAARTVDAEVCKLVRVEDEFDDVYSRYEGRQIVTRESATAIELSAGSLWVPLSGDAALRTTLVLEPVSMYGLYQYPKFRALVQGDGRIPVLRITH